MTKIAFSSLFLFLATSGIYLLDSGSPQLCDLFLLGLFPSALYLAYKNLSGGNRAGLDGRPFKVLLLFLAWVVSINTFYFLAEGDPSTVRSSVQWVYSVGLFAMAVLVFDNMTIRQRVATVTFGLAVSFVLIVSIDGATEAVESDFIYGRRQTFSFNNPNQLAYFCVLAASLNLMMLNVIGRNSTAMTTINILTILAANVLVVVSASRSAIVSIALCDILLVWFLSRTYVTQQLRALFLYGLSGLILLGASTFEFGFNEFKLYERFESFDVVENMSRRVTDRYLQYGYTATRVVIGSGKTGSKGEEEAKFKDFKEVHNSFIDIAASYGLIGFIFFAALCVALAKYKLRINPNTNLYRDLILLTPSLLYMVAHQGLRFRLFWILLAVWTTTRIYRPAPQEDQAARNVRGRQVRLRRPSPR